MTGAEKDHSSNGAASTTAMATARTVRRRFRDALIGVAVLGVTGIMVAGPASAHVTVGTDEARQGASDAVLTFRVPSERSGTSTVKVQISFPRRTPLASVTPEPKAGWTVTTKTVTFEQPITTDDGDFTKGIGEVTYTATTPAAAIPEDRFEAFQVLVGPIPKGVDTLSFPTVQTYANGMVSSWVEPSPPGSEPQHPAPVLRLLPAADGAAGGDGAPSVSGAALAGSQGSDTAADAASTARTARTFGIVGTVVGVLGLLAGGFALWRARSSER
jgi:uncharacterized protein YcnI